ncbi:MAG: cache and HAMP domain-containing protein [Candidatus Kerfeldbacteria bacterium]|nr:cache and HAMP domain-containing protein [Candidatus Kerfeldbacteria bacterium]
MPIAFEPHFHPYRNYIFRLLVGMFVLMLIVSSVFTYFERSRRLFREMQSSLKKIAANVAAQVPADVHEQLTTPDQQESALYQQIEGYFQTVMNANPSITDIYTLRPTENPDEFAFVVSGAGSEDLNGDNFIEENEEKAALGERYDIRPAPTIRDGLRENTVDPGVTYDKWGAWLSGYAPVKDASGVAVAVLGVDVAAEVLAAQRQSLLTTIVIADLVLLPVIVLISLFLAYRLSRPFRALGQGLAHLAHGDWDYRLPMKNRGDEKFFVEMFHSVITMVKASGAHKDRHDHTASSPKKSYP